MTWNVLKPAGSDLLSLGDDVIREMKVDIREALETEGIFPGSNPDAALFKWTGKRGSTGSRPSSPETGEIYFNTELFQMEYWSGSAWTAYDLVPVLSITSDKIAAGAVTSDKIASMESGKLTGAVVPGDNTVTAAKIVDLTIENEKIAARAVTTQKLIDNSIRDASIQSVDFGKVTGVSLDSSNYEAGCFTDAKVHDIAASKVTGTVSVVNGGTGVTTKLFAFIAYTGDGGSSKQITHGMGVAPDIVFVFRTNTDQFYAPVVRSVQMDATYSRDFSNNYFTTGITDQDTQYVTLGNNALVNQSGVAYAMLCIKSQ